MDVKLSLLNTGHTKEINYSVRALPFIPAWVHLILGLGDSAKNKPHDQRRKDEQAPNL